MKRRTVEDLVSTKEVKSSPNRDEEVWDSVVWVVIMVTLALVIPSFIMSLNYAVNSRAMRPRVHFVKSVPSPILFDVGEMITVGEQDGIRIPYKNPCFVDVRVDLAFTVTGALFCEIEGYTKQTIDETQSSASLSALIAWNPDAPEIYRIQCTQDKQQSDSPVSFTLFSSVVMMTPFYDN